MCVWNSGHTCGDVFWPLNDHINNYWALREVLLYLTFIFPDMKTQTSPGPTVQRASSHASSLDLHVKSSHSQLTRLAAFEACWASFCRRQAQRDGTPGYEEGRWRNGRRWKRRRRIRPEGLLSVRVTEGNRAGSRSTLEGIRGENRGLYQSWGRICWLVALQQNQRQQKAFF